MKRTSLQVLLVIMTSMVMAAEEDMTSPEGLSKAYECRHEIWISNFGKDVGRLQEIKKIAQDCLDFPQEVLDCIESKFEEKETVQMAAVKVGLSCIPDLSNLTKTTLYAYFVAKVEFIEQHSIYRPYIESMTEEQMNEWGKRPEQVALEELRTGGDEVIEKFAEETGIPRGFFDAFLKFDVYDRQYEELSSTLGSAERVALQKYKILILTNT